MIKITPADKYFSLCVRERSAWTCEYCGTQYEPHSQGLHCSHFFGRRHKATRWHKDNAFSHCFGCHQKLGSNPHAFTSWVRKELGATRYEILAEKHQEITRIKKPEEKEIAAHYRQEHSRMVNLRNSGITGRIEFESYQ